MASEVDEAMDGADARISNGTCCSEKNIRASDYFIPCGNAAGPDLNFTCCYTDDTCLSRNSCYNANRNSSTAVCDSTGNYTHQAWVGLVRCYVSDDPTAKDEEWTGCQEDQDAFPATPHVCDCKGEKYFFKDNKVLAGMVKVPFSSGGPISFLLDYNPTVTQVVTVSTTSWETVEGPPVIIVATTQIAAPGTSGPAATSVTEIQQSLSTGAEIGVATGVSIAGLLVFGLALVYIFLRTRKNKTGQRTTPEAPESDGERGEMESGASSRRLEGGLISHAKHNEDEEAHISQHGRFSRQYLYGSYVGNCRYPSEFPNDRLSTISEHSTIPDPQSPGSSKVPAPPPQAAVDNSEDSSRGSRLGKKPLELPIHELPG